MALINCTINSQSISVIGGTTNLTTQVLTITPDSGYVVAAADFVAASPPAGVNSITLSDYNTPHGVNNVVFVTVDLDNSYAMPNANTTITVDVDGKALFHGERPFSVAGTWDSAVGSNITPASTTNNAYSASGTYSSSDSLFSVTFTCNSGYFFTSSFYYELLTGVASDYVFTQTNGFTGVNGVSYHTSVTFNVSYVYPQNDVTGDYIRFTIGAAELIPVTTNSITAYSINTSNILETGEQRTLKVYGSIGAKFTVQMVNEDPKYYNWVTDLMRTDEQAQATPTTTIPSEGYYDLPIFFPSVTDDDTYTITISPVSPSTDQITQTKPIVINQLSGRNVTYSTNSASGRTYTSSPSKIYYNPIGDLQSSNVYKEFDLVLTDDVSMVLRRAPVASDWVFTNVDSINTDSSYLTTKAPVTTPAYSANMTPVTSLSITHRGHLFRQGANNSTAILALDNFINIPPVSSNVSNVQVAYNTAKAFNLNASDSQGDALTYSVVSQPSKGSVTISGATATFTPNNNASGATQFSYKVNDTYQDSNTSTVGLVIAGSGSSIQLNDSWWWNDTEVNNTYTGIASTANQGSLSLSGFDVGQTSFTATVSNWTLTSALAGLPSYIDHSGDFSANFEFYDANSTLLDSGSISISSEGTFNGTSSTIHLIQFTVSAGEGSLTAQAYSLRIRVRYTNLSQ